MNHFTFFDSQELDKEEGALNRLLKKNTIEDDIISPSKTSLYNILNYSKALSIRQSKQLETIEHLLN
ncbi:MAG: hypothetical protein CMO34_04315 [Verrucomicrobia bacterium]|nr:hypothetical protein [Verrucomicrobiota bacterium]